MSEMRKFLLILSLEKPRWNAEATVKTNELFIAEDTHYVPISFLKISSK
jgi:hypothetical protein